MSPTFETIWRAGEDLLVRIAFGHYVAIDPTGAIVQRYRAGTEPDGIYYTSYFIVGDQLRSTFSIPEAADTGEYDPRVVVDSLVLLDDPDTRRFVETVLGAASAVEGVEGVEDE